jgi:parallel beta-helix repeat protein
MRRKALGTAVLLAIFILAEINIIATTHAENIPLENNLKQSIIVSNNGDGDYTTIQEAIDNAPEGSVVYVKKGSYNEIINIKKELSLIGEDKANTVINPISEKNKYAIRLGAPGSIIRNFSITNGAPGLYTTGIRISASKTEIHNCNIYDTPVGIASWNSDGIIDNCKFWGCEDEGIALIGNSLSGCNRNKITNCIFYENCDGIELQYSSNNTISNCEFYKNTHTGIDAIASSNNNNTISNCKIYNNEVHGIYLSASSDNKIIDCSILKNNDGNIIMNEYSHNNEIKTSVESDLSSSKTSGILAEIIQTYYESNKEISKISSIKNFFEIILNLMQILTKF